MEQIVDRTVFNDAQIALLNAFANLTSEEEVLLLKQAISEFFAKRAEKALGIRRMEPAGTWKFTDCPLSYAL